MANLGGFGMYSSSAGGSTVPSEDISYGIASGTNTYTVTLLPAITEYTTGLFISVKFTNANTSSTVTVNPNSLGAKTVLNRNGGVLFIGQIQAGGLYNLTYDGTNLIIDNNPYDGDICFFRKTGALTLERWYDSAICAYNAPSSTTLAANSLQAIPFIVPKMITLDRIAMEIIGAGTAGSLVRIGIYASTNVLPIDLVGDYGTIAGDSATFQSITINQTLPPGLYWFACLSNSAAAITFRGIPVAAMPFILGVPNNLGTGNSATTVKSTFTYGALPNPFDNTGISAVAINPGAISVRLSA